ncbi:MAG: hypothetical protein KIT62_10805 [Cyclobacteriaceae bacterium]|nr:hypothetical protein [Cyclobacteriaceae bacterium]
MKKYTTWLKTASVFQFITAVIHATSLFLKPPPANDTEKQLFELMDTYKFDFGAGFHRTMGELTLALSACFCLVCLLGGLINWYLIRKKADTEIMKGIITINLVVFGICFGLMATFAFLPPIVLSGLIFLFLIPARLTISNISNA